VKASNLTTLQIDTERTWRGGEQQALYLAKGLRDRGQRSIVVGQPESPFVRAAGAAGLECQAIRMRGELDLIAAARIAALARRERAAILHAHTSHAHALALLARYLGCSAQVVVARRVDFPVRGGWKYGRRVRQFISVSQAVKDVLVKCGVSEDRVVVVHDGIDVARIDSAPERDYRAEFNLSPSHFVVGNVAHMADHKGQRYLIDAVPLVLASHPEARFLIVGHGELWDSLTSQARRLGVDKQIIFAGFRNDVPSLMKFFDLFVMSSHLEGLCSSLMDAMAGRRPIVATRAGGIPELITHEQNGLLVPTKDVPALGAAIVRMMEDRELAARLSSQGRHSVESQFSVDHMVERTAKTYEELLRSM